MKVESCYTKPGRQTTSLLPLRLRVCVAAFECLTNWESSLEIRVKQIYFCGWWWEETSENLQFIDT